MGSNPWFISSFLLLGIWLFLWIFNSRLRKPMLFAGFLLMPFGLTQLLFVPAYWNPPSIFDLNTKIGFDIESLVFSFAVGGISIALFETFSFNKESYPKVTSKDRMLIISSVCISTLLFRAGQSLHFNPIYSLLISLYAGSIIVMILKPRIILAALKSSIVFLVFYTSYFLILNLAYPHFVSQYWNMANISQVLILGVPLEEFGYAFGFAMMWFMIYSLGLRNYRYNER